MKTFVAAVARARAPADNTPLGGSRTTEALFWFANAEADKASAKFVPLTNTTLVGATAASTDNEVA
jgi:hypothetical protein